MVKISSVTGNSQRLDGGSMFGNAPRALWKNWIQPDEKDRIPLACRALLLEINDKKILLETGIGAFLEPKLADRYGVQNADKHVLLESLNILGLSDSDIDMVILSHLHFDHAGGLLPSFQQIELGNKNLLFPNATYVVSRDAWTRANTPHSRDKASFIPGLQEKLSASRRLKILEKTQLHLENFPELSFFMSSGHTPGQMLTKVKGVSANIIFCGDLIPGKAWVHLPITMGYDRNPELLIDEKLRLYKELNSQNSLLFFTHDPIHCAGHFLKKDDGKYGLSKSIEILDRFSL